MRVVCRICNADIFINQDVTGSEAVHSSCPICHAKFKISQQQGSSELSVEFETKDKVRSECLMCGQIFERPQDQAVPVCENCADPKGDTKTNRSLGELSSQSRLSVSRPALSGRDFENANSRDNFSKPSAFNDSQYDVKNSRRWFQYLQRMPWVQFVLILIVVSAASWFCYRLLSFKLNAQAHPTIKKLIRSIKLEDLHPSETMSFEDRRNQVRTILKADRRNQFPLGIMYTKLNLLSEEADDPKVLEDLLTDLCLLYSSMGIYGEDDAPKEGVIELANTLLTFPGKNISAQACLARGLANSDDRQGALNAANELIDKKTPNVISHLTRSYVLLKGHRSGEPFDDVIEEAEEAIGIDPNYLEGYALVAEAFDKSGFPDRARESIEQRLTLSSLDPFSLYILGNLYFKAGDFSTSRNWLEESLRNASDFSMARGLLAEIQLYIDSNYTLAEKNLKSTIEKNPYLLERGAIWKNKALLADLYARMGRNSEAQRLARSFPLDLKSPGISRKKASILENTASVDLAIKDLLPNTIANPLSYLSHLSLGKAYLSLKNYQNASRAFAQAFAMDDPDLLAGFYLVISLWRGNDTGQALDQAQKIVTEKGLNISKEHAYSFADAPQNKELISIRDTIEDITKKQKGSPTVYFTLAGLSRLNLGIQTNWVGEFKEAAFWFEKASRSVDTLDYIWYYLAITHFYAGNLSRARASIEKSLSLNPSQPGAQYWLALIDIHDKLPQRAKKTLDRLKNIPEWEARAYVQLGNLALSESNKDKAAQYWHKALQSDGTLVEPYKQLLRLK